MSNENETRKLTEDEMEAAKGGQTYGQLPTFKVQSQFNNSPVANLNKAAQTVMCGGQTRDLGAGFNKASTVSR